MALTSESNYFYLSAYKSPDEGNDYRAYFSGKRHSFFFKRIFDLLVSVFAIIFLLSWITPLLAILIKSDSEGPVFFRQRRSGFLGKTFTCYKFRTMRLNDNADDQQAMENDPRITRVGRWLRKPGLDELPQFINVLLGHMSIIGPRPHMLKDNSRFARMIPRYRSRSFVRPGITGLSQVMGCRGLAITYDAIYRRYQWDDYYAKKLSVFLDLKIAVKTVMLMAKYMNRKAGTTLEKPVNHPALISTAPVCKELSDPARQAFHQNS
jgi:putative colanic acid biosynthesis UDP-glucose lipid carrier transferase